MATYLPTLKQLQYLVALRRSPRQQVEHSIDVELARHHGGTPRHCRSSFAIALANVVHSCVSRAN